MWTAFRAHTITMPGKKHLSSVAAMKPKAVPENVDVIEILDTDDEDTKEQCSEDLNEDIEDRKPAAKDPIEPVIHKRQKGIEDFLREMQEVFKDLNPNDKRRITDAFAEAPEPKKRKISDASERSPELTRLKAPPPVVTPAQEAARVEARESESCAELETSRIFEAVSDSNENSVFEALLKTAGEEQQRLQAAEEAVAMPAEDLIDRSMHEHFGCQVDGTPRDDVEYLEPQAQDPNCLAVEKAAVGEVPVAAETTDESKSVVAAESTQQVDENEDDEEEGEYYDFPAEVDDLEDSILINYENTETWDSPLNTRVSALIQWIKDVLPPTFGSFFLFVCGLCCVYVDRLAVWKLSLCLLVFSFNIGNAVVETESGDKPVFCVKLPMNPSKRWRAAVLSICMVGFVTVINVISTLGYKVANRLHAKVY